MNTRCLAALAVLSVLPLANVLAQTERSGNADARVMQQLQQLSAERTSLQAENAKLKQELDKLKMELEQAAAGKKVAETRAQALQATASRGELSSKQTGEQLERARVQLQELIGKFRETAQTLKEVEQDRVAVRSKLELREREFATCVDRNAGLYNLNAEVLDKLENRGFWSSVAEREPFTKLKRVELENLIDGYKYRADELRQPER